MPRAEAMAMLFLLELLFPDQPSSFFLHMHSRSRRRLVLGTLLAGGLAGPAAAADGAPLRVVYPRLLERPEHAFGYQVLGLALQRSGRPYELQLGDALVSSRAALRMLESGQVSVFDNGGSPRLQEVADMVPIPIDFGLGGCRMLLGRPEVLKRLRGAHRIEDLQAFIFGQGIDWTDSRILRKAGLRVEEGEFDKLLRMLQGGRFELLPLGSDEAQGILERQREASPDIAVDVAIDAGVGLLYAYPRVFYVARGNTELFAALTRGLKAAHADGSLLALLKRTPGIGPVLTGERALPATLIGLPNPWMPAALRSLQLAHFHPALRATLRPLLADAQG